MPGRLKMPHCYMEYDRTENGLRDELTRIELKETFIRVGRAEQSIQRLDRCFDGKEGIEAPVEHAQRNHDQHREGDELFASTPHDTQVWPTGRTTVNTAPSGKNLSTD